MQPHLLQRIRRFVARPAAMAVDGRHYGQRPTDEQQAGVIRAAKLAAIMRMTPITMGANVFNSAVLAYSFHDTGPSLFVFGWATAMILFSVSAIVRLWKRRNQPPMKRASEAAIRRAIWRSLVLGCFWAFVPILLFNAASESQRIYLTCVIAGTLSLAGIVLSPIPRAALAVVLPVAFTSTATLVSFGDPILVIAGGLTVVFSLVLLRTAAWFGQLYSEQLTTRAHLQALSDRDTLTGLANRRAFRRQLEEACDELGAFGAPFALVFMDFDGFKTINDSFGHLTGDRLLESAARRLEKCAGEADFLARQGGDEFALILRSAECTEAIAEFAQDIIGRISEPFVLDGISASIGCSLGIALASVDGADPDTLLRKADLALYRAKSGGRGTYRFYEPTMDEGANKRRALELDLRRALARNELYLEFQPIKALADDRICGCEALVRWNHPTGGAIQPEEFISIAEQAGLIARLGTWTLEEACRRACDWPADVYVSVNVSAVQFRSQDVPETVAAALSRFGLHPSRLMLEITESVLVDDIQGTLAALLRLRALGVRISLDDFGTGYASLSYLHKLPFDKIKIDRSFIASMEAGAQSLAIVRAIISLARTLDIRITAEGIETPAQVARLLAEGCDEGQGFLIGRPQSARALHAMLRQRAGLAA